MFKVSLFDPQSNRSQRQSKLAAAICYQPTITDAQEKSDKINIEKTLFKPGHHTTLEHSNHYESFILDDIPVSLVTFGLHFLHPFYNSSQRSGRYCLDMFSDTNKITQYIQQFLTSIFHEISEDQIQNIIAWVLEGYHYFQSHIDEATQLVKESILKERPYYQLNIDTQAKKIAQEQLRAVISTITPTGMMHTLDIIALISLNQAAWSRPLRLLTKQMIDVLSDKYSSGEIFNIINHCDNSIQLTTYTPDFPFLGNLEQTSIRLCQDPVVFVDGNSLTNHAVSELNYISEHMLNNFIDTTYYNPYLNPVEIYSGKCKDIEMTVDVPIVTYGQDQRHRMIRRSNTEITSQFYTAPILCQLKDYQQFTENYYRRYLELCRDIGNEKMLFFIPYGAMVRYRRKADPRAYYHCVGKRLCWNAERAICRMEEQAIEQIMNISQHPVNLGSPCMNKACPEGQRFCGRDLVKRSKRQLI